jgi:hypothetical protein
VILGDPGRYTLFCEGADDMRGARLTVLSIATGSLAGALSPMASPAAQPDGGAAAPALASGDAGMAVLLTGIGALLAVAFVACLLGRQLLAGRYAWRVGGERGR